MGIWVALFVTMAVIPSYWLYFADGTLKWTGTFEVPLGFGDLNLPMEAIRDVIVVDLLRGGPRRLRPGHLPVQQAEPQDAAVR